MRAFLALLVLAAPLYAQRTPDQDPYNKNRIDPAKEFPFINQQADAAIKELKSFGAKMKWHGVDQAAGRDETREGTLKAKRIKGEMWAVLSFPKDPDRCTLRNAVNKKVTELWPETKEFRRTEYKKEAFPIESLLCWQYLPSKLKDDFDLKLVRLALKYKRVDAKGDKPPDDPFGKKAGEFETDQPQTNAVEGPDPNHHHVVELVPKDKKLKAAISSISLHVHAKTFFLARIDVKQSEDGSRSLQVDLSDVQSGGDYPDAEILISTAEWTARK